MNLFRSILFVATIGVGAFPLAAQKPGVAPANGGAQIEFEEKAHDFGDVLESARFITHRFSFKNTGNKDLFINTVQTSCGCTTPEWTRDTIHPGQKGYVDARYETTGRIGSFQKSVTVYSNAINHPFFHLDILGNVLREKTAGDNPQPFNPGQISFSKPTVNFNPVFDNKVDTQEVRVTNSTDFAADFEINGKIPAYCQVINFPKSLDPKESANIKIIIDGTKIKGYGFGAFEIPITTSNPVVPYTGLFVTYTRKQYFPALTAKQLAKAPKLVINKKVLDFGNKESGDILKSEFIFTNTGKQALKLQEIYPECSCIKLDYPKSELAPGESMTVKVTYDTGIKQGKASESIWVVSNDPVEAERYIYVVAHLPEQKKQNCLTCPK
jgi:hypothetical protein